LKNRAEGRISKLDRIRHESDSFQHRFRHVLDQRFLPGDAGCRGGPPRVPHPRPGQIRFNVTTIIIKDLRDIKAADIETYQAESGSQGLNPPGIRVAAMPESGSFHCSDRELAFALACAAVRKCNVCRTLINRQFSESIGREPQILNDFILQFLRFGSDALPASLQVLRLLPNFGRKSSENLKIFARVGR
jgi:hypothetical protein